MPRSPRAGNMPYVVTYSSGTSQSPRDATQASNASPTAAAGAQGGPAFVRIRVSDV